MALTGATSAVMPVRLRPRPYDAAVLEFDSRFTIAPTTVTAHVIPGASIAAFPVPGMHPEPIRLAALPGYQNTGTFLVTGPLGAISGLQEQFHP